MAGSDPKRDPFGARGEFETGEGKAGIYRLEMLEKAGVTRLAKLPFSIRVLLEAALRACDGFEVTAEDVKNIGGWNAAAPARVEIPFKPARVVLQDFTGVPCVVDLAAMRAAMQRLGGDPKRINPLIPVDLVIDHSVQVDFHGAADSLKLNVDKEFERNRERYEFLRWGQKAFQNFRVTPPSVGIVHQVNLEYLAKGVFLRDEANVSRAAGSPAGASRAGGLVAVPDSLVGTDSHTTMINGLGVVGWGVGGIEAEAVMLGQPLYMLLPEVIGFEITGQLPPGTTATDLVLCVTQILRKAGVVNKFVEFFGSGVSHMKVADRATIGNMAPEYGATMGFFPFDRETLEYMRRTGRTTAEVALVERYSKENHLFREEGSAPPTFTQTMSLDLSTVEPSMAGPKRPQDLVPLRSMKESFRKALVAPLGERGFALDGPALRRTGHVEYAGELNGELNGDGRREPDGARGAEIGHGAVVIAAITSCTNTSNPSVMVAAGLLARKAVARGMKVKPYVKTSLAPGSRVVTDYLDKSGLTESLDALGFNTVGYGCTTCIGNSGPLPDPVAKAVADGDLVASAVLSGNRNFEGRVNPLVKANYLASPPLVVAYALAGTTDIDLLSEPLGRDENGKDVFLREIWPTQEEVARTVEQAVLPEMFRSRYSNVLGSNETWNALPTSEGDLYDWNPASTYIQEPPFLVDLAREAGKAHPIKNARVLALLGDSVTTDHISPAGSIAAKSPAGRFLQENGIQPVDFNSYGARRGNDRVMTRGTFANIRIRNHLAPGTEGGVTRHLPDGEVMSIYDAAMKYKAEQTPLVVLAGAEYGTGSSRDWAAKGTFLLGVRAVIAVSFERIHRSNLVGMGVLPLEFPQGETWSSLGIQGDELISVHGLDESLQPGAELRVAAKSLGSTKEFVCKARIDTPVELEYYLNGGILQTVLRKLLNEAK